MKKSIDVIDYENLCERFDVESKKYHTLLVAIPIDFDIEKYLSLKEQANIFEHKSIKKSDLVFLANAVKHSTIFKFYSEEIPYVTISYFISILKDLGVIIDIVYAGEKTKNLISVNVLTERKNEIVVDAIRNIVTVEESM